MRQAIFIFVLLIATFCGYGRRNGESGHIFSDTAFASIPPPEEMLSEIINSIGLQQNFSLRQGRVLNIEATIVHHKRYILYNPEFISWLNRSTRDKWAAMTLIAHEVGHHLNGHTMRRGGSRPALELEADEFAGFVLYKLGASLKEAQEVMLFVAATQSSKTHPARALRIRAIQKGWENANAGRSLNDK